MVRSLSALRAFGLHWQAPHGGWVLTVISKATFDLLPTECVLADRQEEICEEESHWNDDSARSLVGPTDLAPFKPRADVMIVGHAFAPRGEPVRSLVARVVVAEVDKAIEVVGERMWTLEGELRDGARFAKMPLRWERAAGGGDTWNPVGMRLDAVDSYGRTQLPNLQPTGLAAPARGDFIEPIGFGPISEAWPPRRERLGALAAEGSIASWSSRPLPEAFDFGYFNAAPRDQQPASLRDDERIILENLHAEHPRLVTSLPGLRPKAFVQRPGAAPFAIRMACDTLLIDTDRALATVTWRAQIPVERSQETRVYVALEEKGKTLTWNDVEPLVTRARVAARVAQVASTDVRRGEPEVSRTIAAEDEAAARSLMPFAMGGPPPAADPPQPPAPAEPRRRRAKETLMMPVNDEPTSLTRPGLNPLGNAAPAWLSATPEAGGKEAFGPPSVNPRASSPMLQPPPLQASVQPSLVPSLQPSPPALQPQVPAPAPPALGAQPGDSPWAKSRGPERSWPPGDGPSHPQYPAPVQPSRAPSVPPPPAERVWSPSAPAPARVVLPGASSTAALGGVGAASDAAAAVAPTVIAAHALEPSTAPAPHARGWAADRSNVRDYIELLWFDEARAKLVRAQRAFKDALDVDKPPSDAWIDDASAAVEVPDAEKDRRAVYRALTRGKPVELEGIGQAFALATEEEVFSNPIVLVVGDLQFGFDELETLKTTLSIATPLAGGDKRMQAAIDAAAEVLKESRRCTPSIAEGLTSRIREAFTQSTRTLPANYLEATCERMLLEERHYQKRTMLGERRIRALLSLGSGAPLPCYLPEALEKQLPLFPRIRVHLIANAVGQQDQMETHQVALVALAMGRVLPIPGRR